MFGKLVDWWRGLKIKSTMKRNRFEIQRDPIVYEDGIDYNISPDTVKNKLIFSKAFKVWIRLWDMLECGNKLRLPGIIKWKGVKLDLMKEGELTKDEYIGATALWVGLISLMYDECKERYERGEASFEP